MRIGFVAMSGLRACDAELLALGLTLPGFIERGKTIASLPSLGLLTLAGLTPAEHNPQHDGRPRPELSPQRIELFESLRNLAEPDPEPGQPRRRDQS